MMYLKIPVINTKYAPLVSGNRVRAFKYYQEEFAHFMADEMAAYLKNVVKHQTYLRYWKPLSVSYLDYKKKHDLSLNIWEATGFLVNHIEVKKYKDHYLVGPSQSLNYPGTTLKVAQVAHWMEYGTAGKHPIPPRPLFRRVVLYMRKHIYNYLTKFRKLKGLDATY
jgi:hypothetical protein